MRKMFALILAVLMVLGMAACGAKETDATDMEYVKNKGTLVVAVTDFAPMDYIVGDDWVGFDADTAKAFAESLGVECEIVEINWDTKINELNSKSVDCC